MVTSQILDLGEEIRTALRMPTEVRDLKYGTDGWKLLVLHYIELVERDC